MSVLSFFIIIALIIAIWLNILATVAIRYDQFLSRFQKIFQMIFVWLIPFIGASIVLHIVYEHMPNAIPRNWIPYGFRGLIYGPPIKQNRDRADWGTDGGAGGEGRSSSDHGGGDAGD